MIIPEEYGSTRRCRVGSKIDVAHEIYRTPPKCPGTKAIIL